MSLHGISAAQVGVGPLYVAYAQNTALNLTITGSEQSCGVDVTFTADGASQYILAFFAPILAIFTNGDSVQFILRENPAGANTARGILGQFTIGPAPTAEWVVYGLRAITPSAGSVTYRVNAIRNSGTGSPNVVSGAGGAGQYVAASLLVTKLHVQ